MKDEQSWGVYCVYVEDPETGASRTLAHVDATSEELAVAQVVAHSDTKSLRFSDDVRGEIYAERQADR